MCFLESRLGHFHCLPLFTVIDRGENWKCPDLEFDSFPLLKRRGYVPDIILATIEMPDIDKAAIVGNGTLIQATVCRPKRDLRSESNAKEISDALPFLGMKMFFLLYLW